ncbi:MULTISPECIES: LacI family DNA-binding transcriptional regulator [Phyllobacteriaceae]|uniref:LacI family transcriptional regulator n=1 Tax=Mesorhizobium hungaricum TaxID=1566387 RepID=A0A1C2E8Q9_9HYPH|nr:MULTISPECIES: LacI family DNA-binding transcriptional regulator [Mesorhizobium]MBN9236626.1 LacI family DNA-binding transcriptional regulator [Mesorhizobium sp.]MDQ0329216.1 LacI family transcriptional regulator [Mesorhizobium sp. YL-MeA3-2017]OCX23375.1 LacI family transcriptional regulator [Mesorhizobium hungaricum]
MLHVAEAARVSVATVSAYINGTTTVSQELSARIEQAIREIGYKRNAIARSLKVGTTRTVGLTVPHITNPFFTDVVSVIQQAFDRAGYAVMLCCTDEDLNNQDDQIRLLLDRMVDGLIVARVGDSAFLKETVERANVPVVLLDRECENVDTDRVVLDNHQAVFEAITYLVDLGHKRIGYITGSFDISPMRDRMAGYRAALLAAGLTFDQSLVRSGDLHEADGYTAAMQLLSLHERPTAIFSANNPMVVGAMKAIRDIGLSCPEDISIICFDDFPWADVFHPQLTTIAQPVQAIGEQAAMLLLDRLNGNRDAPSRRLVLKGRLMVRNSCRPLSATTGAATPKIATSLV